MTERSASAGWRGLLVRVALLMASLTLAVAVAEIVARAVGAGFSYGYPEGLFRADAETGYAMTPNFGPARFVKHEFETSVSTA